MHQHRPVHYLVKNRLPFDLVVVLRRKSLHRVVKCFFLIVLHYANKTVRHAKILWHNQVVVLFRRLYKLVCPLSAEFVGCKQVCTSDMVLEQHFFSLKVDHSHIWVDNIKIGLIVEEDLSIFGGFKPIQLLICVQYVLHEQDLLISGADLDDNYFFVVLVVLVSTENSLNVVSEDAFDDFRTFLCIEQINLIELALCSFCSVNFESRDQVVFVLLAILSLIQVKVQNFAFAPNDHLPLRKSIVSRVVKELAELIDGRPLFLGNFQSIFDLMLSSILILEALVVLLNVTYHLDEQIFVIF